MPAKKKAVKKVKKVRDPSAYATVSVASSRAEQTVLAVPQPVASKIVRVESTKPPDDDDDETPILLESQVQEATTEDENSVDAWVSLDLARKQAGARIRSETRAKTRTKPGSSAVVLT
ncbi:hypothetical protein EV175_003920 [Coemansia sp. RSA 1933]|nr:hypothetical protein EV175_003920 [Coemansia sp. RSA 1933]